jgi:malonate-semialdehyde dehydrogenase (acetylating)/methylmalonate-semialdehyde dehydrogenase
MFSFTGNKKSISNSGHYFYGKSGLNFFTQQKTITTFWSDAESTEQKASVNMPTMR